MARRFAKNPEVVVVHSTASNPGRGTNMKKRNKRRKKKSRCHVRHVIRCKSRKRKTSSKRRKTARKGGKKRGGPYAQFMKKMWRKHRAKLLKMTFKQRSKWISSQYK